MRKTLLFALLFWCYSYTVLAQAILTPLTSEKRTSGQSRYRSATAPAAVSLPFFDDFATTLGVPDPARWNNGGVYVNNRFAEKPVSKNVATFDGVNQFGEPYLPGATTPGPSDTLTSQPIRLGALSPADSVYLSFYWQSGGLGDVPDQTTENSFYLALEFKDNTGKWQQVWRQQAVGQATDYKQVFVGLKEPRYFHNDFQFRFRNVGQRNGLLDIWNVDYVVMDRNRRKGQNTTSDIAISQTVSPLLKNYTAMPVHQFLEDPAAALADSVTATLNNLGAIPGAISWRGFIRLESAATADTFLVEQGLVPPLARQYKITGKARVSNLALPSVAFKLVHGIRLNTQEQNPLQAANDTTFRSTTFSDFFAHDDGTAEAGFVYPANGSTTQVAIRYELAKPDQVRGFLIYFPRIAPDQEGRSITARVWREEEGKPGKVLYQKSFEIKYTEGANTFYEVTFDEPVPVQGTFFLGWNQPASQFINFGFDRNTRNANSRFLWNSYTGWQPDTYLEGAVMMRPLMTGSTLGIDDEDPVTAGIQVYPNPSTGVVQVSSTYKSVAVYDVTGKQVYAAQRNAQLNTVNLSHLPPGLYTFRVNTGKTIITRKLIIL